MFDFKRLSAVFENDSHTTLTVDVQGTLRLKAGLPAWFSQAEGPVFLFSPRFPVGGCVKVSGEFLYKLPIIQADSKGSHFKGVITVTVAKRNIDEAVREIQNKLLGVMTNKLLHTDMPCSPPWKMCSSKGRPYSIIFPAIITGLMAGTNLSYRLCQMNRGGM